VTGPWTAPLLAPLSVNVPIVPERAQIAFFRRPPSLRHLIYIDTISGSYFRPHGADLTLVGLGGAKRDDADPNYFREANDTDFIHDVGRRLASRIPALANATYMRGHAGIYDVTPDQRPILDEIPGVDGLFVAAGFSGTGFKTAPAVGAAMADMITGGMPANPGTLNDMNYLRDAIHPFSYTRFMTGRLIAGEHEYAMGAEFGHTL